MKPIYFLALLMLTACGKEENPVPVSQVFFECYNARTFGPLAPNAYHGLPKSCQNVFFSDDFFDNKNGWRSTNDGDASFQIQSGTYNVVTKGKFFYWYLNQVDQKYSSFDNFQLEARFLVSSIAGKSDPVGIIWGGIDWNLNIFGIGADGTYFLNKNLVQTTLPTNVKSGSAGSLLKTGDWNKLTVRKYGITTYFFINEVLVFESNAIALAGDDFGFYIPSYANLKIDDLKLSRWSL